MARHHRRSLRRRITDLVDTLLGRTRPRRANLDQLFALPSAAITFSRHWAAPHRPRLGSRSGRRGKAFATVQQEILTCLRGTRAGQPKCSGRVRLRGWWCAPASEEGGGLTGLVTDCTRSTPALKAPGSAVPAVLARSLATPDGRRLALSTCTAGTFTPSPPKSTTGQRPRTPGQRRLEGNWLVKWTRAAGSLSTVAPACDRPCSQCLASAPAHYRGAYRDRS